MILNKKYCIVFLTTNMKKAILLLIIIYYTTKIVAQDATLIYKNTVSSTVTIETDIGLG